MRDAKITLEWADGEYDFKMGIGELRELQEKTRRVKNISGEYIYISPMKLFAMLHADEWMVDDVREAIRIGLVGAGMAAAEAVRLVRRYVDEIPNWNVNCKIAANVVAAALLGWEAEPLGKSEGAKTEPMKTSPSTSPPSSQMQQ
jgi:hypothetical protein